MRALSVRPEYADAIARGEKRIENRSWGRAVRGPIALHRCGRAGAIIGVMEISAVLSADEARQRYPEQVAFISGPLCWVIDSFRPCHPIPCKGRLCLWQAPDEQT